MSTAYKSSIRRINSMLRGSNPHGSDVCESDLAYARCGKVFDAMPDCVSLHSSNGLAFLVSEKAESVLDIKPEVLRNQGFIDCIHVQDRVAVLQAIADCAEYQTSTRAEFRKASQACSLNGKDEQWFEMRCTPFCDEHGGASLNDVLAVTRELSSERSKTENIGKNSVISTISHELRTPLNAIMGFSEMLQGKANGPVSMEKQIEYAGLIHESAAHLLNVLNKVLDASKMDAGKYMIYPEPFDPGLVMKSSIDLMRQLAGCGGVKLIMDIPDTLPEITADPDAVKQILLNLLANAIKFSPPNSTVKVVSRREGRKLIIEVMDNGIGMLPETVDRLGEKFFQAESGSTRDFEGTGLGLSIVFGLVGLHGGDVSFESTKDLGTTVRIALPIIAGSAKPVPADPENEIVYLRSSANDAEFQSLNLAKKIG